ncbi:MAG TPA: hypothetical protein VED59_07750, partial [Acidimicrobiales bacterium]|nr:hypothetical protein [Acidimicrobiales bacterium]
GASRRPGGRGRLDVPHAHWQGPRPEDRIVFSVATLTIALWTATEEWPAAKVRLSRLLGPIAGTMAVLCGLASLPSNGGPFSLLSSMAMIWMGAILSLMASSAAALAAVFAIVVVGLA